MFKGFSKNIYFIIFGQFFANIISKLDEHPTWDIEGGGQIDTPPQGKLVFKNLSRDRVNLKSLPTTYPGFQTPQKG